MATNQVLVSGTITDSASVENLQPVLVTGATTPFSAQVNVTVTTGNNAVTVPSAARAFIVVPTSVTSSPLLLKGPTSADAGLAISPSQQTGPIPLDGGNMPATLNFNSTTTAGSLLVKFL